MYTRKILILPILFYQKFISPFLPISCRYSPTCSQYSKEAIMKYGFAKGFFMSVKRILKCHPIKFLGGSSGLDFVPKKENFKKKY